MALIQINEDAIDLRPENKVALFTARMENGHDDLLTIDRLPFEPAEVAKRIRGLALVDHNVALYHWGDQPKVVAVIDHHSDRGLYPDAHVRIVGTSASCSSLVASEIVRHNHTHSTDGRLPRELAGLLLSAIALDSSGLKDSKAYDVDRRAAASMLKRSFYKGDPLDDVAEELDEELGAARLDLGGLSVRDVRGVQWPRD